MSAALSLYEEPSAPVTIGQQQSAMQDRAVARLSEWAAAASAAFQVAEGLCKTAFVPEAFRGKPLEAAAAILAGSEVGLSPLAALGAFDVIGGRAAAKAITLRGIVQSQGHEIILTESTASRCKMKGRRRGSAQWQEVAWTLDRARDLGLLGKDNWKRQPQAMLLARATSEVCRLVAADAILGISYALEELADGAPVVELSEGVPEQSGTRRMSRPKAQPLPDPDPSADDDPDPDPDGVSAAQLRKIGAAMREHGITERAAALEYVAEVIGRDITSRNELTKAEASQVIDALERAGEPATFAQRAQAATSEDELHALLEEVEEADADTLSSAQKNVLRGLIATRVTQLEQATS